MNPTAVLSLEVGTEVSFAFGFGAFRVSGRGNVVEVSSCGDRSVVVEVAEVQKGPAVSGYNVGSKASILPAFLSLPSPTN